MMQRCHRPTASGFARYGGRGITVCSRWRNSYAAFLEDMGERPIGMTLDRIDNDGNYEPANCRWADHIQQQLNKATTIVVMLDGEALSLAHASRRLGRDPQVIRRRIQENGDPRIPHARERPLPIS